MSHVEETAGEPSNPCAFCGEGETCRHGDGCELCCLDCRREEDTFDQGWNAAIAEVRKKVDGYIEAKQEGQPVAPWEEWLPQLLALLAER